MDLQFKKNMKQQTKIISFKQIINQRYAQSIKNWLKSNQITFTEKPISNSQNNQQTLFQISLPQQIASTQSSFYYVLMKKYYELRKVLNPQLTFQSFLSLYNDELNQKLTKYGISKLINSQTSSNYLNQVIMQSQINLLKFQTANLIKSKKNEILFLEKQTEKTKKEYAQMINNLVQKNACLNVQNIDYQLRLKLHELKQKEKATKIYLPSQSMKKKMIAYDVKNYRQKSTKINYDKKQEVQRIKVVVNNNMWGWGDKINQRLQRLKALQEQLQQN